MATPQLTATELCDMVDSILHLLLGWSYTWQCLYIKWERYRHKVGRNNKAIWCKWLHEDPEGIWCGSTLPPAPANTKDDVIGERLFHAIVDRAAITRSAQMVSAGKRKRKRKRKKIFLEKHEIFIVRSSSLDILYLFCSMFSQESDSFDCIELESSWSS